MFRLFVGIGCLVLLMSSSLLGASLDILEVLPDRIIVQGSADSDVRIGDRFGVLDYDGKEFCAVEVIDYEVVPGQLFNDYVCKIVTCDSEIKPGYTLKKFELLVRGGDYLEYSRINLDQEANPLFETLSGEKANIRDKGTVISFGGFVVDLESSVPIGIAIASSYISMGQIKTWEVLHFALILRPTFMDDHLSLGLWAGGGAGPTFGTLRWQRPDSTYDDDIDRNSGEAKISSLNIGMTFTYRFMATATISPYKAIGLQLRAGYIGFAYNKFVDNDIADGVSRGEYERWKIEESWMETDIGKGRFSIGIAFLLTGFAATE